MEQQDLVTKISHESIKEMEKHHTAFCQVFAEFNTMLEQKEENNFKYLRCRLDFNMYYQMQQMMEMNEGKDGQNEDEDMYDFGEDGDNQNGI